MTPILRVFRYEFIRVFKARSYLFFTFGIPVIALVLYFGLTAINNNNKPKDANGNEPPAVPTLTAKANTLFADNTKLGVVDQSGMITDKVSVSPFTRYADFAEAEAALHAGKIDSFYVIKPDYLKTGKIELWMTRLNTNNENNKTLQTILRNGLKAQLTSGNIDPAISNIITSSTLTVTNNLITSAKTSEANPLGANFILVYGFVMTFMLGVFFASGMLMQSVVEEKETRVVEILISSMRPGQLLIGKILALGALGIFQVMLWALTGAYIIGRLAASVSNMSMASISPIQIMLLAVYYVLGYLMFAAVYAGVGALSNNIREGPQIAAIFTLPAMTPLYLTALFAAQPDGALATGLSLFPITAPMAMVMRISVSTVPVWQLALSIVLLALTGIAFMWLAGRIFRLVIMLAGQPPKWRDIPRLLREQN
jgi:ABC-2 type transport system permease protein